MLPSSYHQLCAGLSHALSAPSGMLKASLQEGTTPPTIQEEQPLLTADSCDSQGFAARPQSSSDHSAHSSSSAGGTSSSSAPAVQVPPHLPSARAHPQCFRDALTCLHCPSESSRLPTSLL